MKQVHHSETVKQDDAHASPKARSKHNPFSFFKPVASSLALLSAVTFSPMILPQPAAAQDAAWNNPAEEAGDFSYWHLSFGLGLGSSVIREIRNVPLMITDVPIYPGDWGSAGPINPDLSFASDVQFGMYLGLAHGIVFNGGKTMAEFGFGANFPELSNQQENNGDTWLWPVMNERNYEGGTGDTLTYVRGYGTALTYYYIDLDPDFVPYAFAEIGTSPENSFRISAGCRIGLENYAANSGWDRWDSLTTYKNYEFTTLITGMPYVSLGLQSDLGTDSDKSFGLSAYGGVKFRMLNLPWALARQTDMFFQPAWEFGLTMDFCFSPKAGKSELWW